jgi:hypothetical protein
MKRLSYNHISNLTKTDDVLLGKLQSFNKHYYSSVIIVHDEFHPTEILQAVNDLIQPSASIVIFS